MAPPRKVESGPEGAYKTTTIRMPNEQFARVDLFATAAGESMVEFMRQAAEDRIQKLANDPKIKKKIQAHITRQQRMLDRIASLANIGGNGSSPEDED